MRAATIPLEIQTPTLEALEAKTTVYRESGQSAATFQCHKSDFQPSRAFADNMHLRNFPDRRKPCPYILSTGRKR